MQASSSNERNTGGSRSKRTIGVLTQDASPRPVRLIAFFTPAEIFGNITLNPKGNS
jgi:hypothetical protein